VSNQHKTLTQVTQPINLLIYLIIY